jgi:ABC-type multidrug transport system fused ATPase/permease subunit
MLHLLKNIYLLLTPRRRVQFFLVMALMLLGAAAEMLTLGAIVPFLGILTNPELLQGSSRGAMVLRHVADWLGMAPLPAAAAIFIACAIAAAGLRLLLSWASFKFVFAVGADFGRDVYTKTLHQPYSFHIERNSSESIASIDKVNALVTSVMLPTMQIVVAATMVLAILTGMLLVDFTVSMVTGATFGLLYGFISMWAKKRLIACGEAISEEGHVKYKVIQESLGGIRDVIIDGCQDVYIAHFVRADQRMRNAQARINLLASSPKYVVESLGMIMFVAIAYGLSSRAGASVAIPVLGALAIGAQRLLPYMQVVYNSIATIRGSLASANDVMAVLALPSPAPQVQQASFSLQPAQTEPRISLQRIQFGYGGDKPPVLTDVNLDILPGQKIGFVGATGSGKSTLIDLIMGLLTPTAGQIKVNGVALDASNVRAWQGQIAHVPQAIYLNDSTIAENVALGVAANDIDQSKLEQALRQAQVWDFVTGLPEGIRTRVGERGVQLSGGQRQRLGIARALYKHADVLVLDEATSALDNQTEAAVMDAIYRLRPDLVVIMIAHRLSTLQGCDRLIEVAKGQLHPRPQP